MGQASRRYVEEQFDGRKLTTQLGEVLKA